MHINLNMCFVCSKESSHQTVLLSTHNICFGWEIKKIALPYAFLSGGLQSLSVLLAVFKIDKIKEAVENTIILLCFQDLSDPRFFFYLTSLILTNTIDVKHVGVIDAHCVTWTYFWAALFLTNAQMPVNKNNLVFFLDNYTHFRLYISYYKLNARIIHHWSL